MPPWNPSFETTERLRTLLYATNFKLQRLGEFKGEVYDDESLKRKKNHGTQRIRLLMKRMRIEGELQQRDLDEIYRAGRESVMKIAEESQDRIRAMFAKARLDL